MPKKIGVVKNKTIILAIDQASKCGWCTEHDYGVWDFTTRKDESSGMKWLRFRAKLEEVFEMVKMTVIAYERPAGRNKHALIHAAKLIAMIEIFCEENKIAYRAYSATEVKKFATGKGNAGKLLVIKAVKEKYGYEGEDDNEADAIAIYHLTKKDLNIK